MIYLWGSFIIAKWHVRLQLIGKMPLNFKDYRFQKKIYYIAPENLLGSIFQMMVGGLLQQMY